MGFPSPALDYAQQRLSLDEHLIRHPAATFIFKAECPAMHAAGIDRGDLLIVDRSLEPADGSIVLISLYGQIVLRCLRMRGGVTWMHTADGDLAPQILSDIDCTLWGIVTHVIKALRV